MEEPVALPDLPYDESGLQSLFGYGSSAHARSGGICQLCGCGSGPEVDFDLWRQLTIEHLIGEGQGGYPNRIRPAVDERFAHLPENERRSLSGLLHELNIVTACQFCNSTTSRDRAPFTMEELIADLPSSPADALVAAANRLDEILESKRRRVHWKLASVYRGFLDRIEPQILARRHEEPSYLEPRDLSIFSPED